jgi:uncharacterized protein YbbC (DUF1343 family)
MFYPRFSPARVRFAFLLLLSLWLQLPAVYARDGVITGAERMEAYLPLLKDKKVALLVNQTSTVNGVLLPDTLLRRGLHIVKIFSPEHGFRGQADAGAEVGSGIDSATGLPVISLYGKNKKPTAAQLEDVDVVVYDIQDVGARFYTYISTLQYLMEACGENRKPLIILDRPNPLGFMVDGPVLDTAFRSFVGMQPIPAVYGMTPGEYAKMLAGEHWLSGAAPSLTVIPCDHYSHQTLYELPVAPSPNLKNNAAIYLYPSLCLFEGTVISVGRGTDFPFQQYGHPDLLNQPDSFRPERRPGATKPPLLDQWCHGRNLPRNADSALNILQGQMSLQWILDAYQNFPQKDQFFIPFFDKLAGNDLLRQQITAGLSGETIRASWQPALKAFKKIRAKYLLYTD